ncbi:hypothetical protein GCM10010517_56140 [Streptosporangium fragile]|uniref:DUF3098 domain-containing protein n=1 Tax=Streptosporangium fragile TaxID=46186 RepID=A0ABN3W4K0_9ACTN
MRPDMDPSTAGGSGPARPERRLLHRTDWMALLSGVLFIGVGIVFVNAPSIEPLAMLPVVVSGLGLAGLVAILVKAVRR